MTDRLFMSGLHSTGFMFLEFVCVVTRPDPRMSDGMLFVTLLPYHLSTVSMQSYEAILERSRTAPGESKVLVNTMHKDEGPCICVSSVIESVYSPRRCNPELRMPPLHQDLFNQTLCGPCRLRGVSYLNDACDACKVLQSFRMLCEVFFGNPQKVVGGVVCLHS